MHSHVYRYALIEALAALVMATTGMAATEPIAVTHVFTDVFADGSGVAPTVIALPAMTFTMGSQPREPGYHMMQVAHRVTLSPFAIGRSEVTNAEYCVFLNDPETRAFDPRWLLMVELPELCRITEKNGRWVPRPGTERQPVVTVTWYGARMYCRWLSAETGQTYELPTAAQWEAAARAGTTTALPWGEAPDARFARTKLGDATGLADAGAYPPNAWGLHEMIGNAWEWVLDCFELDFYHFSPARDPLLFDERCNAPEIRGGSWADDASQARPAFRTNYPWSGITDRIGFRVARGMAEERDEERGGSR